VESELDTDFRSCKEQQALRMLQKSEGFPGACKASACQNHDIMAAVGVARDRAGKAGTASSHIALPRLSSSRHNHNDNSSSPDLLNLINVTQPCIVSAVASTAAATTSGLSY
jgi:hypothetical protein